jgi:1-deoxy-D-xylulose-5-phosphate synthase
MAHSLLKNINTPADLKQLPVDKLPELAIELRQFIVDIVAAKEGHLGASLGTVELTIALHYFFDAPEDRIVWDVGHQAYGHKILTGRRDNFESNRKTGGLSGFPKRSESDYDTFGTGHSSTSISAALGMAMAAKLNGFRERNHVAVIGDASIASGMAFEALNHAGATSANIWVILNDNAIGIDPSVGALKNYLAKSTLKNPSVSNGENLFETLNFHYHGPVDGHNLSDLQRAFEKLSKKEGPKLLHVITKKGKGLVKAEEQQTLYHAPGKFDRKTGKLTKKKGSKYPKYQDVFGETILELAKKNENIIGITPAMPTGSSLKLMMEEFPERAFDVGIAEQHAVTLSAGMATEGKTVFCTIYSTFLQRAYDQLIHDVALQQLPVIFCVDRAGLVGEDGPTHHGVFDLAYLRCIPNMIVAAPADAVELRQLLYTASLGLKFPLAIRYPRGRGKPENWKLSFEKMEIGRGKCLQKGKDIAVCFVGGVKENIQQALKNLGLKNKAGLYDFRFVKPLDKELALEVFSNYKTIITVEDGSVLGGFGESLAVEAQEVHFQGKIIKLGIPDQFIEHGKAEELHDLVGISAERIQEVLEDELKR